MKLTLSNRMVEIPTDENGQCLPPYYCDLCGGEIPASEKPHKIEDCIRSLNKRLEKLENK